MTRWIDLTGAQHERLQNVLLKVFDVEGLERLLAFRLEVTLYNTVSRGPAQDVVFKLVKVAQQEGWLDDLLLALSEARPGQQILEELKTELGLGKSVPADAAVKLEAFVKGVGGLLDPEVFRTKLAKAEAAVCRISYPNPAGAPYGGTGFLVGPDVVMTNYHVMKYVIEGKVPPSAVKVLFDFKLDSDGNEVNQGNSYGLTDSWLVDHSPYASTDVHAVPAIPDTPADQLDYALVRLEQAVGCLPVPTNVPGRAKGGTAEGDLPRGFVQVAEQPPALAPHAPLLILQHPSIGMMKLAWAPDSIIAINGSGTRVRHGTATLPGSSGSPCFDADFNVVALHHAGDPAETSEIPATYNQAVPMPAIVDLLDKHGHGDVLRGQCVGG